jgi:hypothetical protein
MKVLQAPTEDFIKRDRTKLAADVAAGSSIVTTMENATTYRVNDYVVLGVEGSLQAELCQITAITGQAVTLATVLFPHKTDEPVVQYRYNQRKFYGSVTLG